jgi:hypothetical protein
MGITSMSIQDLKKKVTYPIKQNETFEKLGENHHVFSLEMKPLKMSLPCSKKSFI